MNPFRRVRVTPLSNDDVVRRGAFWRQATPAVGPF
jgi:hypothetical protein